MRAWVGCPLSLIPWAPVDACVIHCTCACGCERALQGLAGGEAQGRAPCRCAQAPQLEHGPQDHRGLGHTHEQGEARGH